MKFVCDARVSLSHSLEKIIIDELLEDCKAFWSKRWSYDEFQNHKDVENWEIDEIVAH